MTQKWPKEKVEIIGKLLRRVDELFVEMQNITSQIRNIATEETGENCVSGVETLEHSVHEVYDPHAV